jgi:peptidoglycan hydrolase-like protein with peptidoglycan-binding domain
MSITVLRRGSSGPETLDLQYLLHFRSPIEPAALGGFDGVFGPRTEQAVRDFQTKRSLLVDGVVGPQTWGSLVPKSPGGPDTWPRQPGEFLRQGDQGADVKRLQQGLNRQGFAAGPEDGDFGPLTRGAVIRLQSVGSPSSNREGVLGPLTWGSAIAD